MSEARSTLFRSVILCALSLSIGWGVRGNFGHSHGAMIPGALAALAAVLVAGREDWWRRAGYFGMFGALGWAFGGRMSYMQVIAYTHSGHWPSQLYGFACLAVIGFLWAALGGVWTALPATLNREQLTRLFPPVLTVLAAWFVKNLVLARLLLQYPSDQRHESPLYWHDTSWVDALVALVALLGYALFERLALRRPISWGTRFLLSLALGWWAAFAVVIVVLVDGLGINFRMTPPRDDDWVGTLGMVAGALVFLLRGGMVPVVRATLITGFIGGAGFAGATFLKLVEVKWVPLVLGHFFGESSWQTNWHSVLEQTYGLINGIGVGVAMHVLADELPELPEDRPQSKPDRLPYRRWTDVAAVAFVLLLVTYLNVITDVPNWIGMKAIPEKLYGLPTLAWFNVGYAFLAIAVIALLSRHVVDPLPLVPISALGQTQLLYLVLLWWIVVGNLMHAIPLFAEQRLITEGVIHMNAVCCTVLALLWPREIVDRAFRAHSAKSWNLLGITGAGLAGLALLTAFAYTGTRAIHGSNFVGQANYHVRFGPDAPPPLPQKGLKHP